ncbi:MAG: FeoB-associated Cys-rich membrane protein [Eubacteriales bacterium]
MENFIVACVLLLIIGAAIFYIVREKKKGAKCIGCPHGKHCTGNCGGCGKHGKQEHKEN